MPQPCWGNRIWPIVTGDSSPPFSHYISPCRNSKIWFGLPGFESYIIMLCILCNLLFLPNCNFFSFIHADMGAYSSCIFHQCLVFIMWICQNAFIFSPWKNIWRACRFAFRNIWLGHNYMGLVVWVCNCFFWACTEEQWLACRIWTSSASSVMLKSCPK